MVIEIFLLALASIVRPTSLAAVSTIVARDSRRRLMFAYVTCGLTATLVFGVVVVGVFHGVHLNAGSNETKGIADVIGGVIAVTFGLALLTGVLGRQPTHQPGDRANAQITRLGRHLTVRVAALMGPLTHIPGVFYLIALNIIVANNPQLPGGAVAVAIYDVIWFAVPIAALAMCMLDPSMAQRIVAEVETTARQHGRAITLAATFIVGTALILHGALLL